MRRDLRAQWIAELPEDAVAVTTLPAIAREYSWAEIATMTRAAPARLLGLADRGHLAPGARADVAVYRPQADLAAMFREAALVFKDGALVVRDGAVVARPSGRVLAVSPGFDRAIERRLDDFANRAWGVAHSAFDVPAGIVPAEVVPCAA
jgi:formylmethanofuran dehydrogenase subunit A